MCNTADNIFVAQLCFSSLFLIKTTITLLSVKLIIEDRKTAEKLTTYAEVKTFSTNTSLSPFHLKHWRVAVLSIWTFLPPFQRNSSYKEIPSSGTAPIWFKAGKQKGVTFLRPTPYWCHTSGTPFPRKHMWLCLCKPLDCSSRQSFTDGLLISPSCPLPNHYICLFYCFISFN